MGLFLNVVIAPNINEENIKKSFETITTAHPEWNLLPKECKYQSCDSGIQVLLNEMCTGDESLTEEISRELMSPVMMCYIYDGDFWGYCFYENGVELDCFYPMPDYFEEASAEERKRVQGDSKLISKYFHVEEEKIKNYLQEWTDEILDGERSHAYGDDKFYIGEEWQMADFMAAIGFPYPW